MLELICTQNIFSDYSVITVYFTDYSVNHEKLLGKKGTPISGERSFRYKPYSHAGRSYEKYVVLINIFQEIRSQRTSLVPRLLTAANCLNQKNLSPCFCTLRALRVHPHSACTILAHTHRSSTATLDTLDATQCLLGFMVTEVTTTCG